MGQNRPTWILASLLISSRLLPAQEGAWRYHQYHDQLHETIRDVFTLEGVYLRPPRTQAEHPPSIMVECSAGKVVMNYFNIGTRATWGTMLGARVVDGFEARIDGKMKGIVVDDISDDGETLSFTRGGLKQVLNAKVVLIGVNEYLGPQVVMRFEMPDPAPVMEKCGADRVLKPRDRWVKPLKDAK